MKTTPIKISLLGEKIELILNYSPYGWSLTYQDAVYMEGYYYYNGKPVVSTSYRELTLIYEPIKNMVFKALMKDKENLKQVIKNQQEK